MSDEEACPLNASTLHKLNTHVAVNVSPSAVSSVVHDNHNTPDQNILKNDKAQLVLIVQPENRFRYRYDTEMSGTHGSLQGIKSGKEKSAPTVQLINFSDEALIRLSLVTCDEKYEHYPHPHSLFVKEKLYHKQVYENWDNKTPTKTGHYCGPHYIRVGGKRDYTARFEGLCIINSKKEYFQSTVWEKIQMRLLEKKYGTYTNHSLRKSVSEESANKVEEAVNSVDVDFVTLCFEAFREEGGKLYSICPAIYSEPIGNAKSAKTGKLKISRINKCSGSCRGGDEIWMLVEKISKKGLTVKFWEEINGNIIWQSSLGGNDLILHHQYAIVFKTPTYRDVNISSEVEVLMRLERTSPTSQLNDYSEPITFVYEPSKSAFMKGNNLYRKESILTPLKHANIKKPKTDSSFLALGNSQSKSETNEIEFESQNLEDSAESDMERFLFDVKDEFELDQIWGRLNLEEFLNFVSADDIETPSQGDGILEANKNRLEFLYRLYVLYSKLDESSDSKRVIDEGNTSKVSRKEGQTKKNVVARDQVKDAASTLLSLRCSAASNQNEIYESGKTVINDKLRDALIRYKSENINLENLTNGHVNVSRTVRESFLNYQISDAEFLEKNIDNTLRIRKKLLNSHLGREKRFSSDFLDDMAVLNSNVHSPADRKDVPKA